MERRTKYFAKPVERHGLKFGSGVEAARYQELLLRQDAAEITNLCVHPRFLLQNGFRDLAGTWWRAIQYEADYSYIEGGKLVVEDVKALDRRTGKPRITGDAAIKIKLFRRLHPEIVFKILAT